MSARAPVEAELAMMRRALCRMRARVADLEAQAKAHAEALVIAHGVGAASRNGEARRFLRELAEVLAERDAERTARKDAESRLWDSQRLKDNYSSELKVVIGERDALKSENDILESAEEAGCTASRNKCMDELAQMLGIDADPLSDEHITGAVDELLAQRDDARGAMAAQDEREKVAGEMCGVLHHLHGCDWPDAVSDHVVVLSAKLTTSRAFLSESLPTLIRLLNHADPECSICGGDATSTAAGHHKACAVRRIDAFLEGK